MGGTPIAGRFLCAGKSQSAMDDDVWGTPMTKRNPPLVNHMSICFMVKAMAPTRTINGTFHPRVSA